MDNIYIYTKPFPHGKVHEFVLPCIDGYTIYIDDNLTREQQEAAYHHALRHIQAGDFDRDNIQDIEADAHDLPKEPVRSSPIQSVPVRTPELPKEDPKQAARRKRRQQRIKRELRRIERRVARFESEGRDYNEYAFSRHEQAMMDALPR